MPHARTSPEPPDGLFPTEDEIAERAFELCFVHREVGTITRGCLQMAEKELLELAADRALLYAFGGTSHTRLRGLT
jgi:hypothetical protein